MRILGFELINTIKKKKKWTNEDLARASGVPKATIDKLTSGATTNPNFDTVWALAEALGCSVDDFKAKKSPAPAEASAEEISLEESNNLLVALGYIKPGEQISDEDLAFLGHVIGLLDTWFDKGH